MFRSTSTGFNKYDVSERTGQTAKMWENENMYKTSYFKQSDKNPLAMRNSTEQFLQTRSNNLRDVSSKAEYFKRPVENPDFVNYDYNNLFRTSYTDMSTKLPKLTNSHYIPGYKGFVSGLKSENTFGSNKTRLSKERMGEFDKKRFSDNYCPNPNESQFNPLSRTHGNFWKGKPELAVQKSFGHHDFTTKLKESGYSDNHYTFDGTGWVPNKSLDGDMKRTEYRIQHNSKKEIHYKGPLYSIGKLKKKEQNYIHT